jgi:putative ABC transport system permease protein
MTLLKLTLNSLWNRRTNLLLTMLSITICITLLLGVEYIRKEAKSTFLSTVSGTDLVVGARTGQVQLLLYSVFRIGNATNNISWDSYRAFAEQPQVEWTIPISLGDSHRGYRVLGTNQDYFNHYSYGDQQLLSFSAGKHFSGVFEAVLGAEVARKLGYQAGDEIVLAHGAGRGNLALHEDKPFRVAGILEPTGTPIDRTVHIPLEGIEAIHTDWIGGTQIPGYRINADQALRRNLQPKVITAFLVGLKSRAAAFKVQRTINDYKQEPLLAIIPGVALAQLWQAIGQFENVLRIVSGFVVLAGLLGMLTAILSTLNERRREMAILRAVGAHPRQVFMLFVLEAMVLVISSCALGSALVFTLPFVLRSWVIENYGFSLSQWIPGKDEFLLLVLVVIVAFFCSLIPAVIAYRRSLQDGLTVRL